MPSDHTLDTTIRVLPFLLLVLLPTRQYIVDRIFYNYDIVSLVVLRRNIPDNAMLLLLLLVRLMMVAMAADLVLSFFLLDHESSR